MEKIIVLINPFASATYLSEELSKAFVYTIAIFTIDSMDTNGYLTVNKNLFNKQIYLKNSSANEIINSLKKYKIDYIINGSEFSTDLADEVSYALLPNLSNNPIDTNYRVNKFHMQEALRENGLPSIKQIKFNSCELDKVLVEQEIFFPCFCKPLKGLATVGAFKANNALELKSKFNDFLCTKTFINTDEYLIQEYITGEEVFVDTFSYKGFHYISSVQKYKKELINGKPVLRYSELVYDPVLWDKCADFVKKILSATNFNNGFAHTEIFITENDHMKLIEINPRISGGRGYCNKLTKVLGLKTQIDLLISALYSTPEESLLANKVGFARRLYLFNWHETPLKNPESILNNFSSIFSYELLNPINYINKSLEKDVTNIDLFLLIFSLDMSEIDSISSYIFKLEQEGKLL